MSAIDIINNPKYDISYIEFNRDSIPWKINTSYICQDNQMYRDGEFSQQFVNISNNLIIESSQNNIVLSTSKNNRVDVNNNMKIGNNLDVSNNIKATNIVLRDISLSNILYLNSSLTTNIIGNLNIQGSISQVGVSGANIETSQTSFSNATLNYSKFLGNQSLRGIIALTDICNSNLVNVDINNSRIFGTKIGYNLNDNVDASDAAFVNINSNKLILNKGLTGASNNTSIQFINSAQTINSNDTININSDNSGNIYKLKIDKHLLIGSNDPLGTSFFNGNIDCNTITYKRLDPDICLNNYTNVSFGNFTISGNIILTKDISFNIGSSNTKFNNIYSKNFIGDLSGNANTCSLASNLVKNLDMSFNNMDVNETITSKNIIPLNNISTLGNPTKIWKNAYINDLSVNNRIDVSGNIKCNTIDVNGKTYTRDIFDSFLNQGNVTAFNFNNVTLKNKIVLDNSNNNYIFFQDLSKTLFDFSNGVLDGSAVSVTSKTFNNLSNFYYKLEITGFTASNDISFNYIYNENVSQTLTLNQNTFQAINPFDNTFFTNKKYPVLFLYNNTSNPKLIIATQNNNLKSITIDSSNNFTATLYKLYAKPKAVNDGSIYTTSNFYNNGGASGVNNKTTINISDLYYTDNIIDNSNNIRIGTGLLNNASNQILIGNYNETFDRSGNNVILGNNYCEAWLPPHGYITDLGSSNYPFKNCFLSENLDVGGQINSKSIIPSTSNTFTLGDTSKFWKNAYITDLSVNNLSVIGNVGIGTISPAYKLDVDGTTRIIGATTLSSTLNVIGKTLIQDLSAGATDISSTLKVTGATTLSSTLNVPSALTTLNSLTVSNATILNSTLNVIGKTIIRDLSAGATDISSTLKVTGATTLNNTLSVPSALTTLNSLTVSNASLLTGNVGIGTIDTSTYKLNIGGTTNSLNAGPTRLASLNVTGNTTLANLSVGLVTNDNISYLNGVTSNIQGQFGTINTNISTINDKINNVTNESKATMFANPTFTGTITNNGSLNMNGNNITNCNDVYSNNILCSRIKYSYAGNNNGTIYFEGQGIDTPKIISGTSNNVAAVYFKGEVQIQNQNGHSTTYFNYTADGNNYIRGNKTNMQCPLDMGNNNIDNAKDINLNSGYFLRINGNGGVYWQNHGGGWNMDESTTMKVYGNKNIYTTGNVTCTDVTCSRLFVNEIYYKENNNVWIKFINNANGNPSVKIQGYEYNNLRDGYVHARNAVGDTTGYNISDDRLKQNESNIINSLSLIRKLQPQTYDMTTEFYDASYVGTISGEYKHRAGFIAQKIRAIEEISYCCIGEEYDSSNNPTSLAIDYNTIFTYNVAATQELDTLLKEQQTKITNLENTVTNLQNENISIKNDYTILKNTLNNLLLELGKNTI